MSQHRRGLSGRARLWSGAGFTLIEVLVVVAIIALLIAILLPSLKAARAQARIAVCKGNQHELGNAFNMYANTFAGYYPLTAGSGFDSYSSLGYRGTDPAGAWKSHYLKNLSVLICPATTNVIRQQTLRWPQAFTTFTSQGATEHIAYMEFNGELSDIDKTADGGRDDSRGGSSYEYNGCYDSAPKDQNGKYKHPLSGAHKRNTHFKFLPARMVLVHDNDNRINDNNLGCLNAKNTGNNCPQPWDNHGSTGMNMMFGDGHADFVKKLPGTWNDFTNANSMGICPDVPSVNASLDRLFTYSQQPWGCLP